MDLLLDIIYSVADPVFEPLRLDPCIHPGTVSPGTIYKNPRLSDITPLLSVSLLPHQGVGRFTAFVLVFARAPGPQPLLGFDVAKGDGRASGCLSASALWKEMYPDVGRLNIEHLARLFEGDEGYVSGRWSGKVR
jgi:hypothetical protein